MVVLVHIAMADVTITRRQNAIALFKAFAEQALSAGVAPTGLEQSFAAQLQISPSMWSQIKSARPIGDKLARQIERHCGKAAGWLNEDRVTDSVSPAEQQFLVIALKAWRSTNSVGRKELRTHLRQIAEG